MAFKTRKRQYWRQIIQNPRQYVFSYHDYNSGVYKLLREIPGYLAAEWSLRNKVYGKFVPVLLLLDWKSFMNMESLIKILWLQYSRAQSHHIFPFHMSVAVNQYSKECSFLKYTCKKHMWFLSPFVWLDIWSFICQVSTGNKKGWRENYFGH